MPWMGITEEDWNGLKSGFLKTVQPNSFSKLIPAACNFKNNAQETFVYLDSLILSFTCNFFAYFKFHSDWGRVISKIKHHELDCRDTAPLSLIFGPPFARTSLNLVMCSHFLTLELINTSFIFAYLRGCVRKLCKAEWIYQWNGIP